MVDRILNPQQELFLERYTNPKSPTFGNAVQSALAAKYSEDYANNITALMPDWLMENIGDMRRLKKAEKNLTEVQELPAINEEGKIDAQILGHKIKVDTFLVERLDKKKYSTRTETDVTTQGEKIASVSPEILALAKEYEEKLKGNL